MSKNPPDSDKPTESDSERHQRKMRHRKAAFDKRVAERNQEKGLLIVHTGPGKGKSSAAFGMALRCLGHQMKVGVVQFIKGAWETGEAKLFAQFPDLIDFRQMGEGFTWETQNREKDIATAETAWSQARKMIDDPAYQMIILDEINIALRYDYLDLEKVLTVLNNRRADLHIVCTGRNAKPEMIDAADLATEMTLLKHPFRAGIKAQAGVEY